MKDLVYVGLNIGTLLGWGVLLAVSFGALVLAANPEYHCKGPLGWLLILGKWAIMVLIVYGLLLAVIGVFWLALWACGGGSYQEVFWWLLRSIVFPIAHLFGPK